MGYAQEYNVERYLRECFVPRIAPVSRVSISIQTVAATALKSTSTAANSNCALGNDHELYQRASSGASAKLLNDG